MATLSDERIALLLKPYVPAGTQLEERIGGLIPKFSTYLDLLLRWNERTNLTAIREPELIVQRHFGESVFAAAVISRSPEPFETKLMLLDFGSGAGFPGVPIQLCLPEMRVCLAESQGKKAAFLREVVRTLGLTTEVWSGRVEDMPANRIFNAVTLRAVDKMDRALHAAGGRVNRGGRMIVLAGAETAVSAEWTLEQRVAIPNSNAEFVYLLSK